MKQVTLQAKKEFKLCQHLFFIKMETNLKTLLEPIKTEFAIPLLSTHESWRLTLNSHITIRFLINSILCVFGTLVPNRNVSVNFSKTAK